MAMSWLFMLLAVNPLNSLLSHPPRDFASLLDPAAVLQTMNVETTDEALVAVLAAPADAASADLYVKKLMAIRLLEQNKSAKALPALEATAKGADVTLRDAALEAIAAINGKPSPRPNGAALLKELARSVPADAGFVVALDFERDSKGSTVRALLENALKETRGEGRAQSAGEPQHAARGRRHDAADQAVRHRNDPASRAGTRPGARRDRQPAHGRRHADPSSRNGHAAERELSLLRGQGPVRPRAHRRVAGEHRRFREARNRRTCRLCQQATARWKSACSTRTRSWSPS